MPEPLTTEMETDHREWARGTRVYGTAYPIVRLLLITVPAIVSAKDNLLGSPLSVLVSWVPIMALLVSIVTAIDTWMKPREKWRGFMREALDEIRRTFADLGRRGPRSNLEPPFFLQRLQFPLVVIPFQRFPLASRSLEAFP